MCVCVCVRERECVCVCESACACACVCVRVRERVNECVCLCTCTRECVWSCCGGDASSVLQQGSAVSHTYSFISSLCLCLSLSRLFRVVEVLLLCELSSPHSPHFSVLHLICTSALSYGCHSFLVPLLCL